MLGPYAAKKDGTIDYKGNRIFSPLKDILHVRVPVADIKNRVTDLKTNQMWSHIARINHRVNASTNEYFDKMGALFTALPMTTRMISSPGAVYGKDVIDYTTDTCPITLRWFDLRRRAFLSESSQIYLELSLLQNGVNVYITGCTGQCKNPFSIKQSAEFHDAAKKLKVSVIGCSHYLTEKWAMQKSVPFFDTILPSEFIEDENQLKILD